MRKIVLRTLRSLSPLWLIAAFQSTDCVRIHAQSQSPASDEGAVRIVENSIQALGGRSSIAGYKQLVIDVQATIDPKKSRRAVWSTDLQKATLTIRQDVAPADDGLADQSGRTNPRTASKQTVPPHSIYPGRSISMIAAESPLNALIYEVDHSKCRLNLASGKESGLPSIFNDESQVAVWINCTDETEGNHVSLWVFSRQSSLPAAIWGPRVVGIGVQKADTAVFEGYYTTLGGVQLPVLTHVKYSSGYKQELTFSNARFSKDEPTFRNPR